VKDQARNLRKLRLEQMDNKKNQNKKLRTITIASGKGGVGKTTLTVNLAVALSRAGKEVMILDADLGTANVDILFGIMPRYTLLDFIKGEKSLKEIVVKGHEGVKIIPGCSGIYEINNTSAWQREKLINDLENYGQNMDFLLVDSGAGISKEVIGFLAAADEVIIIVSPEPTSITDGYGIIKILSRIKKHGEVNLVINRARNLQEINETFKKLETVAARFLDIKLNRLGFILEDRNIENAIKEMVPFCIKYPRTVGAHNLIQIAERLIADEKYWLNANSQTTEGFYSKLFNLFRNTKKRI
jgi:flagellar biosynthesis protein FlhG